MGDIRLSKRCGFANPLAFAGVNQLVKCLGGVGPQAIGCEPPLPVIFCGARGVHARVFPEAEEVLGRSYRPNRRTLKEKFDKMVM